jgi:hypothetical protein
MLAGFALASVVRRLSVRTGVSNEEAFGSLPGDDIIPHPMVEWTRGITVHTTAERVWPWLVKMGYGRGGWYTPEWVDLFANRRVFGVGRRFPASADRLLPEYAHVAVGDLICDSPNYASNFRVERVAPGTPWSTARFVILGGGARSTSPIRSRPGEWSNSCSMPARTWTSPGP